MAQSISNGNPSDHITKLKELTAKGNLNRGGNRLSGPLKYTGLLDKYKNFKSTTVIGQEFPNLQLKEILEASNADDMIRDLAVLVSQRGVVFFRNQDITMEQQKDLGMRLGLLTGKPTTSKLHIHPTTWQSSESGSEIAEISTRRNKQFHGFYDRRAEFDSKERASKGWHSDVTFEHTPSDYAILKLHTLPESGGDTLWASGYEVYDRLSPPFQKFLEGLTAYHSGDQFIRLAEALQKELRSERGSPENIGVDLDVIHPVVRTNPVTGWKSIYTPNHFTRHIMDVHSVESQAIMDHIYHLIAENHDLQVRFSWAKNDLAIWDNRSTYHAATFDVVGARHGDRVASLGERPFYDSNSKSRREALGEPILIK